jgi:hypothetical protein
LRAIELAILTFDRVDGVVINHGVLSPMTRLENASIDEWKKHYDVNFFSALALVSWEQHVRHGICADTLQDEGSNPPSPGQDGPDCVCVLRGRD